MNLHYYCLNCGIKFLSPSIYKSCDYCNCEYRIGKKYKYCKRCNEEKQFNKYGLCLNCYKLIQKLEEKEEQNNRRR